MSGYIARGFPSRLRRDNPAQPILDSAGWTWLNILARVPLDVTFRQVRLAADCFSHRAARFGRPAVWLDARP